MSHEAVGEAQKLCMADTGSGEAPRLCAPIITGMLLQQQHLITALKSGLLPVPLRTPQGSGCTWSSQLMPQTQILLEKRECNLPSPHAEN